jgi:hypothetical protein
MVPKLITLYQNLHYTPYLIVFEKINNINNFSQVISDNLQSPDEYVEL